ncbi:MAG: hypothetical protein ING19_00505 [Azospirillum sp.]|nr:hypothetical protein [Azospirillum sp.]
MPPRSSKRSINFFASKRASERIARTRPKKTPLRRRRGLSEARRHNATRRRHAPRTNRWRIKMSEKAKKNTAALLAQNEGSTDLVVSKAPLRTQHWAVVAGRVLLTAYHAGRDPESIDWNDVSDALSHALDAFDLDAEKLSDAQSAFGDEEDGNGRRNVLNLIFDPDPERLAAGNEKTERLLEKFDANLLRVIGNADVADPDAIELATRMLIQSYYGLERSCEDVELSDIDAVAKHYAIGFGLSPEKMNILDDEPEETHPSSSIRP